MKPLDYAKLCQRCYTDPPTIGAPGSASRMRVYGGVHCFRGSDDVESWLHDFDISTVFVPGLGEVHRGFWDATAALIPACVAFGAPDAITGHSLGAAMAILYAGAWAEMGKSIPVYAFEPPRLCADDTLQTLLKFRGAHWYATRNGNDIVTQLPPTMRLPWPLTHIGTASEPFDNMVDHSIARVIEALSVARAAA